MSDKPTDFWVTLSFTPTVGWTNHYSKLNGGNYSEPCPGVLTQELWQIDRFSNGEARRQTGPFATRAMPATFGAENELVPVDEASNYIETTCRGQEPDRHWSAL